MHASQNDVRISLSSITMYYRPCMSVSPSTPRRSSALPEYASPDSVVSQVPEGIKIPPLPFGEVPGENTYVGFPVADVNGGPPILVSHQQPYMDPNTGKLWYTCAIVTQGMKIFIARKRNETNWRKISGK